LSPLNCLLTELGLLLAKLYVWAVPNQ